MDLIDSIAATQSNNTSKSSSVDSITKPKSQVETPSGGASTKSFYKELALTHSGMQPGSTRSLNYNLPLHSPLATPLRTPNTPSPHSRLVDPFESSVASPSLPKSSSFQLDAHMPSSDSNRDSTGYASSTSQPTNKTAISSNSTTTPQHFFPPGMDLSAQARYDFSQTSSSHVESSATPTGPHSDFFTQNTSDHDIYSIRFAPDARSQLQSPRANATRITSPRPPPQLPPPPFDRLPFNGQLQVVNDSFVNQWNDLESIMFAVSVLNRLNPVQSNFVEMLANMCIFPKNRQQINSTTDDLSRNLSNKSRAISMPVLNGISQKYNGMVQLEEMSVLLQYLPGPHNSNILNFGRLTDKYVQIIEQGCLCILDPMAHFDVSPSTQNIQAGIHLASNVLSIALIHPAFDREQRQTLSGLSHQIKQKLAPPVAVGTPKPRRYSSHEGSEARSPRVWLQTPAHEAAPQNQQRGPDAIGAWRKDAAAATGEGDKELSAAEQYAAQIRHWLKVHRLHKYYEIMVNYPYDELLNLNLASLEAKNVTEGARKKLISIIGRMRERQQLLKKTHASLTQISKTFPHNPSPSHNNTLKSYSDNVKSNATDLKDILDSPLGPDTLDRRIVTESMDLLVRLTQKYFSRDINLSTKLVDMVKICGEHPAKRVKVSDEWLKIRIPSRMRHCYSSLPNCNAYNGPRVAISSSFKNYNTAPNDGNYSRSSSSKTYVQSPKPDIPSLPSPLGLNLFDASQPPGHSRNGTVTSRIPEHDEYQQRIGISNSFERPFSASFLHNSFSENVSVPSGSGELREPAGRVVPNE